LNPLRIVNTWNGRRLRSKVSLRVPAIIKHHEHGFNLVRVSDFKELLNPLFKASWILLPQKRMKEDSDDSKPDTLGISELPIDGRKIKSLGLPHL
jgi:hypothetical protein